MEHRTVDLPTAPATGPGLMVGSMHLGRNVSMILRQLVLEFREENTNDAGLVQRTLHDSPVLVRVKRSKRSISALVRWMSSSC